MDLVEDLRAFGLSLPGAHRKSPWPDHDDLAVNDKTFAYLPAKGKPFSLSCKLPYTGYDALQLPFASPTKRTPTFGSTCRRWRTTIMCATWRNW